jgi:hypothetical protein
VVLKVTENVSRNIIVIAGNLPDIERQQFSINILLEIHFVSYLGKKEMSFLILSCNSKIPIIISTDMLSLRVSVILI